MLVDKRVKHYVVGFVFFNHESIQHVLLIRKDRPEWQAGDYNGIGGKMEFGESSLAAIQREVFEEADISPEGWRSFAFLEGEDFEIEAFCVFLDAKPNWTSKTSEQVEAFPVNRLPSNLVGSAGSLIQLALNKQLHHATLYVS